MVLGIGIRLHQLRIFQPCFHGLCTALQGSGVAITFADHPAQQGDVGLEVLNNRLFAQTNRTAGSRALGRSVGQFKCLLHFQVGQTFDLQNATGEDVLFAFFGNSQITALDGCVRNGVNQVTQGDAWLHFALETHQHRFWHIQRHNPCSGSKSHQAGAGREGNTDRETGV